MQQNPEQPRDVKIAGRFANSVPLGYQFAHHGQFEHILSSHFSRRLPFTGTDAEDDVTVREVGSMGAGRGAGAFSREKLNWLNESALPS